MPDLAIDWSLQRHPAAQAASQRRSLLSGWFVCASEPGVHVGPGDLPPDLVWDAAVRLGPVAQVLRDRGAWTLDAPSRRFDEHDWWYRLSFEVDARSDEGWSTLGLEGLATVAEVWLNGERVLFSQDMFLRHELDVGGLLRAGTNELVMVFRSLDAFLSKRRPRPRWRVPMIENQQLRWVRTTVLGRTPGWSPPCAVVGPWKNVWLEQSTPCKIGDVQLCTALDGGRGGVAFSCALLRSPLVRLTGGRLIVEFDGVRQAFAVDVSVDGRVSAQADLGDVQVWWPHTHGPSARYAVRVEFDFEALSEPLVFDLGHVGFRSVKVDQADGDFAVLINGVPVFCRGACWTPLDPVTLTGEPDQYKHAIAQLVDAGLNMVRVGGTMVYESDAFYDECDRQGVMVWQDFMFASMDFPEEAAFVDLVCQEAGQQLRRWQGRPCLTVLCGNSEVEQQAAMWGATRDRWSPALFQQTLAAQAHQWCPDVPYWPSSAHGGSFPHQGDVGTTSYYGVGAYMRSLDDARRSNVKFATECLAFANVPESTAIEAMPGGMSLRVTHANWKARAPRDLGAGWDFEDVRDHYLTQVFAVDPMRLRYADHDRYLLLSRVVTGEVMAATFTEWRRTSSSCGGGLIWFLRDLWPGAGWGVIDSLGRPKAAYYYLRRTLQPVSLSLSDEGGNGLFVHIHNERARPLAARVQIRAYRAGGALAGHGQREFLLPPRQSQTLPVMEWFDWFTDLNWAYRFGPCTAQVVVANLVDEHDAVLAQAWHFPQGMALRQELDVGLRAQALPMDDGRWQLTVSTRSFAQAVSVEVEGYLADDAYFHLAPGESKTIWMTPILNEPRQSGPNLTGTVSALNSDVAATIEVLLAASSTLV